MVRPLTRGLLGIWEVPVTTRVPVADLRTLPPTRLPLGSLRRTRFWRRSFRVRILPTLGGRAQQESDFPEQQSSDGQARQEMIFLERSSEHRDREVNASEHKFRSVPAVMVGAWELLSGILPCRLTQRSPRSLPFQSLPDTLPKYSRSCWSPDKSERSSFAARLIGSGGVASRTRALGPAGSTAGLPPSRKIPHTRYRTVRVPRKIARQVRTPIVVWHRM
jgi:hypothetical protein